MDNWQQHILDGFEPISLQEMDAIKLMNRQDTKYVLNIAKLPLVLKKLCEYYSILEIEGNRTAFYQNVYFDTTDFKFYNDHHRGKLNRHKVRNRAYVESDLAFCEVKFKSNKERTIKKRTLLDEMEREYSQNALAFVQNSSSLKEEQLEPKLAIDFTRITLAHKNFEDRCTIDFNLTAYNNTDSFSFDNVAIAEIKQHKFNANSIFNLVLKSEGIRPMRFSKYCMSAIKLYPHLKYNRFKPRLLQFNKIQHGIS